MEDQHVREHENAKFSCEVYPQKSALEWTINGRKVQDSKKHKLTVNGAQRHLLIKDASEADHYVRICGSLEDNTSEARLLVDGKYLYVFNGLRNARELDHYIKCVLIYIEKYLY